MTASKALTLSDFLFDPEQKKKYDKPLYGIEVETESLQLYEADDIVRGMMYMATKDGSLRNYGVEYVSLGGLEKSVAKNDTNILIARLLKVPGILEDCPRAGIHVHANVRNMTVSQVWTMACIYWALEDPLTEWCGKSRVGNNFCLRLKDATRLVGTSVNAIRSELLGKPDNLTMFERFTKNNCKYSGLNLATVATLGTLEFRSLDGKLDGTRIENWIDQIDHIRALAIEFGNPHNFFDWVDKNDDKDKLFKKLLTPYFRDQIDLDTTFKTFYTNLCYPLAIAYSCNDWAKLEDVVRERYKDYNKKNPKVNQWALRDNPMPVAGGVNVNVIIPDDPFLPELNDELDEIE